MGYIEFKCSYDNKKNSGFCEEVVSEGFGPTNTLRRFQFEKTPDNNAVIVTGIEITEYCEGYCGDTTVEIPEKIMDLPVAAIGKNASDMSESGVEITDVKFPKTVKSIADGAFADLCDMNSVKIPKTVQDIGKYAFGYVHDIKTDTYEKTDDFVIYCEKGSKAEEYAVQNGFDCEPLAE